MGLGKATRSKESNMIDIPKDIEKYLVRDEVVEKRFTLKEHNVFTSKNRLFIKQGNTVRDISYAHISSIELQVKRNWSIIFIGILLIAYTFYVQQDNPPSWTFIGPPGRLMHSEIWWFFIILGVFLITLGFLRKTPSIKLSVAGVSEKQVLSGDKDTIDALFRLINERRFNLSNANSDAKTN